MTASSSPTFKLANLTGKTVRIKSSGSAAEADGYMTLPPDPGVVHVDVYETERWVEPSIIRKVGGPAASAALGWRVTHWTPHSLIEHRIRISDLPPGTTAVLVSPTVALAMMSSKWTNCCRAFTPQSWNDVEEIISTDALFELNNEPWACKICGQYHGHPPVRCPRIIPVPADSASADDAVQKITLTQDAVHSVQMHDSPPTVSQQPQAAPTLLSDQTEPSETDSKS